MDLTLSKEIYSVANKDQFPAILFQLNMEYLRKDVSEFLLRRSSEEEYYDINGFHEKYTKYCEGGTIGKLMIALILELNELGWKCLSAYSGNGLYIYSTDKEPATVW